jgi:hypothetical protein
VILCTAVWLELVNPRASTGLTDSSDLRMTSSDVFHNPPPSYPQPDRAWWTDLPAVHADGRAPDVGSRRNRAGPNAMTMPGDQPSVPAGDVRSTVVVLAGLVLGGAAVGALIVALTIGANDVALVVGALTLPMVLGLGYAAWRSLLGAWLAAKLGGALLRSRGDEARFRDEVRTSFAAIRDAGLGALPFTWVFVVVGIVVAFAGGIVLALLGGLDRPAGPILLATSATGFGILLRRLARAGRLPLPAE